MNRLEKTFACLKMSNRIAFIPFAVAGDPSLSASEAIFKTYLDAGADIVEIGYPFSDPVADGPVNQRAARRAIAAGLDHTNFFKLVAAIRKSIDVPIGILIYANSVFHLGYKTFCKRAADCGIDSILVADLPPEESGEMLDAMDRYDVKSVFIVSELTPPERMRSICKAVNGFVYVVSRLGPTGVQKTLEAAVSDTLAGLHTITKLPLCVGFGISKPEHVAQLKKAGADGAIVGSNLVAIIENNLGNPKKMQASLAKSVREFKKAT